jgi:AcrR family transcriptional regulator
MAKTQPQKPQAPDRYHHGALKSALVRAGREILEEGGPRALTMREAAKRAGVSYGAPGYHFSSIRVFLAECAAEGFLDFTAALKAAEDAVPAADAAEMLCEMSKAYVRFAFANRAIFRLMFDGDSFTKPTKALEEAKVEAYRRLVEGVKRLDPGVSAAELEFRIASSWSIVHGYAILSLEDQICRSEDTVETSAEMSARTLRTFLKGLDLT